MTTQPIIMIIYGLLSKNPEVGLVPSTDYQTMDQCVKSANTLQLEFNAKHKDSHIFISCEKLDHTAKICPIPQQGAPRKGTGKMR